MKPIVLATIIVLAMVATPAAAQTNSDDSPVDDLLAGVDDNASTLDQARAVAEGVFGLVTGRVSAATDRVVDLFGSDSGPDAATVASDVDTFLTDRSAEFVTYANGRLPPSNSTDVLEVTYESGGSTATHFIIGSHNDTHWTGLSVVESTGRTVDQRCTISGDAAADAVDVLETAYSEYIEPDEPVDPQYVGRLTGRYANDVNCSFGG